MDTKTARLASMAALALSVAGCASSHQIVDRADFLAEATRTYNTESRERVIEAAQIVLRHSDPTDFEFRNSLNGFVGLRRYFVYAVIASASGREKWEFETEQPAPGVVKASVSVSEAGRAASGYSSSRYESAMNSIPLYRLFWNRVDYMLGRRPDWVSCDQAAAELKATRTSETSLGGLCGPTSDGRNSPAPPQLPPAKVAAVEPPSPPATTRRR